MALTRLDRLDILRQAEALDAVRGFDNFLKVVKSKTIFDNFLKVVKSKKREIISTTESIILL